MLMYSLVLIMGIISLIAQARVSSTFNKYSNVESRKGLSGAEVAKMMLRNSGIYDVTVERASGFLTDHYNPTTKTLKLSSKVYDSSSISALGVAAHETGHAIQHAKVYTPLKLRSNLVPIANFGSRLSTPLIFLGFLFNSSTGSNLLLAGIVLFSLSVIFTLVTLPVEFDASKRAIRLLVEDRFLDTNEVDGAKAVLDAAAMTYVAAAMVAIAQLLRLLSIYNRRSE